MNNTQELMILNSREKEGREIVEDCDFTLESAFADDRLTICCKNQEAALQTLRESYGAGYGKPVPGSASDIRGQKYQKSVNKEVIDLCRMIYNHGLRLTNGHTLMLFGEIFNIYQKISNKVVGILARARKNRLVHFEGETLWQGKNDETNVTLLRSIKDIDCHFQETGDLLYNEEANDLIVLRLKDELYNTFCVKVNFSLTPHQPEESCEPLPPFQPITDIACATDYQSNQPPLVNHTTMEPVETKTARKPVVLEPTAIRLNRGLRNLDNSKNERIVLDFSCRDLVSSGVA